MSPTIPADTLLALGKQFGTPLYVYHADTIEKQFSTIKEAFRDSDARFFYACKALTNLSILKVIRETGCGIDCSSINEVHLALRAGFHPENILYTSSSIAFEEIETAKEIGVNINIDSYSNLEKFARRYGGSYGVGIRLRPGIMAGGNLKISTGHDKSKFGIPLNQLDAVRSLISTYGLKVRGLHIHTGSDVKDAEVFLKGVGVLFELSSSFPDLQYLDLGGGFKVAYHDQDIEIDMAALGQKLGEAFATFQQQQQRKLQFWFEPGKYLVSKAGYFLTSVNVLKPTDTIHFAGVNSGFNHLIRPMFYDAYHHIENISNPGARKQIYTVVGNICETDTFGTDREIAELREGDTLLFYNAGAYGIEMASNYNSRFRPAEVMVNGEAIYLIRRREEMEDLIRNQVFEKVDLDK